MKEFVQKYATYFIFVVVALSLVMFGFSKPSKEEQQAQANAQEIIKLVNTQNTFNNKILVNKQIIDNANKAISGAVQTIDETEKLISATNDRLKKYNLKYGQ